MMRWPHAAGSGSPPDVSSLASHPLTPSFARAVERTQAIRAPSDVSLLKCALCGEPIEMFHDDAANDWMLRDVVESADHPGQYCHAACVG